MPKSSYRKRLLEDLRDPLEAASYINAAIEDSPEMLLTALRDVATAHSMAKVAKGAGVAREAVYRMLSNKGNPSLRSLRGVLSTLGLDFVVIPARAKLRNMGKVESFMQSVKRKPKSIRSRVDTSIQLAFPFPNKTTVANISEHEQSVTNISERGSSQTVHDEIIHIPPFMIPNQEVVYAETY